MVGTASTAPSEQIVIRRRVTVKVSAIVTHQFPLLLTVAIIIIADLFDASSVRGYDCLVKSILVDL